MNSIIGDLIIIVGMVFLVGVVLGVIENNELTKQCEAKGGELISKDLCINKIFLIKA